MQVTRVWAKQMPRAVICSLDYRLAPATRWPAQVDDVWQAYYWLVTNCESYLGFKPKKIILAGDSAGAGLILSMTTMSIQRGFRVPDGIFGVYPNVNVCQREFWPSLLLSLDDNFLPISFLHLSVVSYLPNDHLHDLNVLTSEYLSPGLYTKPEILAKYPMTIFSVGSADPFKDDIYRFVSRMLEAGAHNVSMREFRMLGHGFLSHNLKGEGILNESKEGNSELVHLLGEWITEIIDDEGD